jgi:bacteriocin biosynthesis cyclodehydratase domain-containing protein
VTHAAHREARAAGRAGTRDDQGLLGRSREPGEGRRRPDPGSPRLPRLKQAIEVLPASDGRIYLLRGEVADDFAIEDGPAARTLIAGLDGSRGTEEVAALVAERHPDTAAADTIGSIRRLSELGLVEDAADDDVLPPVDRARYERQLRYFGELVGPGHSRAEPQRRLARARVVMLGVGGLGSWAAYALASTGIGRLDVFDGDDVEISNLNRQILFAESDIGQPKAVAAARSLARFNPRMEVRACARRLESAEDVGEAVEGADFVVDAADWPAHRLERWVTLACFARGIPFITMSQLPPLARLGPLFVPGETGCYFCLEAQHRARHPLYDELAAGKGLVPSPAATFAPVCGLIGSHVAMETVHFLTGLITPSTLGKALMVDCRTMAVTEEGVPRRPGCAVCGPTHGTASS